MNYSIGRWIGPAVAMVVCAVLGAVVLTAASPFPVANAQVMPPAAPPVEGPITYYNDNCNRCHGQVEAAYPDSRNPPKGEALKNVILEMAEGPAQAPIEGLALAEQIRLHEAIFTGGPFAAVVSHDKASIQGERIPGTDVFVRMGDRLIPAKAEGERFRLPAGATGTLVATRNGKTIEQSLNPTAASRPAE